MSLLIDWIHVDTGEVDAYLGGYSGVDAGSMQPVDDRVDDNGYAWRRTGWIWTPCAHCEIPAEAVIRDFQAWRAALPVEVGPAVDLDDLDAPTAQRPPDGEDLAPAALPRQPPRFEEQPLERVRFEAAGARGGRVEFSHRGQRTWAGARSETN